MIRERACPAALASDASASGVADCIRATRSSPRSQWARWARWARSAWFPLACALLVVAACGGDDSSGSASPTDAGTDTASKSDASTSSGQPQTIPRRDAQISDIPDPIGDCDLNNPNTCPNGEVCDLLVRRGPGEDFVAESGCVPAIDERAEGDPCYPDPTSGEPFSAPGVTDLVFRDPCGPGLVCAPNSKVRGSYSCQPFCSSGAPCKDATAVCMNGTITPFCRKTDGCDVEKQTGCRPGEVCYLVPSDDRTQLLSLCSSKPKTPTPDGMLGCRALTCNAGSVCLGPVRTPISAWSDNNRMCRRICNGEMGVAPAPADEDAGVPIGLCSESTRCEPYSASGLLLSAIPAPPFGQCESQ